MCEKLYVDVFVRRKLLQETVVLPPPLYSGTMAAPMVKQAQMKFTLISEIFQGTSANVYSALKGINYKSSSIDKVKQSDAINFIG